MVQAPVKEKIKMNEITNKANTICPSNSLKLGHKISKQAEYLRKQQVPHSLLTFLDSNNHAGFTVTHYHYTGRT